MSRSISLVGLPGGGKSTIGRQLAKRLKWQFLDSDAVIENQAGCSISAIFEGESGESRFRDMESAVIDELCGRESIVLATGGGAVLRDVNRRRLHALTHVVYLRSTPEELFRRLRHDTQRPLLQVRDPQAKLRELYEQRDPLYREVSHFVIETGRPSVASIVNMVLMQLELAGAVDPGAVLSPVEPGRV